MDDRSQVAQEAERLKSQKKDLKIIQNIFHSIATLRAVGELFTREEEELRECKKFVHLVVDQGQPGTTRRLRMRQIRDNMQARIGRIDKIYLPDDHNKVEELYEEYLGSQRASDISAALNIIDDEIYEVSTQRSKLQKTRDTPKKVPMKMTSLRQPSVRRNHAKTGHFDDIVRESNGHIRRDLPSGIEIDLDSHPTPRKTVKRPTKGDKEIHTLSEALKVLQARTPVSSGIQSTTKDTNEHGSGSDIPEDQADQISHQGSHFIHHGRSSGANIGDHDMDEINRLENARQRDEARASAPVSQLFDPELVARMKQRTLEAGRVVMTGEGEGDEEQVELSDWSDADSDVSAASSSSLSSFDGTVQLYKYTVRGQFVGTQSYNDGDIVTFKTFWKLTNATAYLQDVIKSLHREYMGNLDDHFELQHRHHKGLYEQVLTIGANHDVQARVWTDRELVLVDTCKLAANKARKRQLAESDEVYQVTWENITTTTTTTNTSPVIRTATLSSQERHTDNDKNCIVHACHSSDTPSSHTTTTTERCPDPVIHRNLASANRMAKEDFMTWYSQFFPVEEHKHSCVTEKGTLFFDYSGMLKQINEAHEDELKRLGDVGCFRAEEEMALTETNDDDVAAAAGGRITKTELMKVYVKPVMVLGPKN
ncbi:hypothetical protein DV737_g2186, partial [Chaetothyriales sp. CBS 132003]